VTLPSIEPVNNNDNHLKNLSYIVRKPKGANAPPRASRLGRERFSISLPGENGSNEFGSNGAFPNINVSSLAQNSGHDIKIISKLEHLELKGPIHSQQSLRDVSSATISMLKIQGLPAGPVKEEQINAVLNLFKNFGEAPSIIDGRLEVGDDIWDEFEDSEKLKNNLEMLLVCKKMNLHFEVARSHNLPGFLVIPKFHCMKCYESWLINHQVPTHCEHPEQPIRGAPIALDERAQIFLKDQNVSYIEIQGSQALMNRKFRKPTLTSSALRARILLSNRDSRTRHVDSKTGVETVPTRPTTGKQTTTPKRPDSEASAIEIASDEKSHRPSPLLLARSHDEDSTHGITDVLIKSSNSGPNDGMRKYGGLTNSQAKIFVDKNSLTKVEEAEQRQKHYNSASRNTTSPLAKKSSKDGLFGKRTYNKKNKRQRGSKGQARKNGSKTRLVDKTGATEETLVNVSDEAMPKGEYSYRRVLMGGASKGQMGAGERRPSGVSNNLMTLDLGDEAKDPRASTNKANANIRERKTRKNSTNTAPGARRDSLDSAASRSSQHGGSRRGSLPDNEKQQYKVQGQGRNIQRQDGKRGGGFTYNTSSNALGLGFSQTPSSQATSRGNEGSGSEGEENDEDADSSKTQSRARYGSPTGRTDSGHSREGTSRSGMVKRRGILKTKNRDGVYGDRSGSPLPDMQRRGSERTGSGHLVRMSDHGSAGSISSERKSSAHARCFDGNGTSYDSAGNLVGSADWMKQRSPKSQNSLGPVQSKKRNIFFSTRWAKPQKGEDLTPSENGLRTPTPPSQFPRCDLTAIKMMSMTSRISFSYYQNIPGPLRKNKEMLAQAMNGRRKPKKR